MYDNFLQDLPHPPVCCMQVGTRFLLLTICTVGTRFLLLTICTVGTRFPLLTICTVGTRFPLLTICTVGTRFPLLTICTVGTRFLLLTNCTVDISHCLTHFKFNKVLLLRDHYQFFISEPSQHSLLAAV